MLSRYLHININSRNSGNRSISLNCQGAAAVDNHVSSGREKARALHKNAKVKPNYKLGKPLEAQTGLKWVIAMSLEDDGFVSAGLEVSCKTKVP